MNKIAVLGANPAWQKTLRFKTFTYGKVNRAFQTEEFASGKGVNFCRACRITEKAVPVLLQFAGGENGQKLVSMLDYLEIKHATAFTATPTRCCITILNEEDFSTTECIEPSYAVSDNEISDLLSLAEKTLPQCTSAAICGTLPGQTDLKVYTKFAAVAAKNSIPLLLDACKGTDDIFNTGCTIDLKINYDELTLLTEQKDIPTAMKQLFERKSNIRTIAITNGPELAFASDGKRVFSYRLPELNNIVSTLGCGDTASAVYASYLASGMEFALAFKKALAAASANCLSALCGEYSLSNAKQIEENIEVTLC